MTQYYSTINGSYVLYHSGIKGMKWGIRRFQNEDGSLTDEGKKRYAKLTGKIDKQVRKIEKYQRKVDNQSGRYLRAQRKKAKAAKLKNRAMNAWLMSDKKRAKLSLKADRLAAKAAKMENNTLKNEAKIKRAQSLINKYSRKIAKFNPTSPYATSQFVNGYYQKKLSEI